MNTMRKDYEDWYRNQNKCKPQNNETALTWVSYQAGYQKATKRAAELVDAPYLWPADTYTLPAAIRKLGFTGEAAQEAPKQPPEPHRTMHRAEITLLGRIIDGRGTFRFSNLEHGKQATDQILKPINPPAPPLLPGPVCGGTGVGNPMKDKDDEILRLRETITSLRANLRSVTDGYESLFMNGEPPMGRSDSDKDAYAGWCSRVRGQITSAQKILEATKGEGIN
jgi:hypothetical protein